MIDIFRPEANIPLDNFRQKKLYIDEWTEQSFNETGGGNYISREELAALGQIFRSAEGCDIFKNITGVYIGSKADMKTLFESASRGEINLKEVLKSPLLKKYTARTGPNHID